jgi:apolipoprotein N-acyltransferase
MFWPLALLLLRKLDRFQLPYALTLPLVWVALEYFRDHFPTAYPFMRPFGMHQLAGFGWYALAYSQHAFVPLIQAADLGGTYLISAAVAAVNGALYEWALRTKAFRRWVRLPAVWRPHTFHRELWVTALAVGFFGVTLGYGTYRLIHPPFDVGPRVAAIQENVPQNEKMGDHIGLFDKHDELCRQAANSFDRPDLILWPETCYPFADVTLTNGADWHALDGHLADDFAIQEGGLLNVAEMRQQAQPARRTPEERAARAKFLTLCELGRAGYAKKYWNTNVVLGLSGIETDGVTQRKFNSARLVTADGTPGPRYDKMHLVPFGEYLPFRETFPFMKSFSPYPDPEYSNTPGERFTRFEFDTLRPVFRSGQELTKGGGRFSEPKAVTYRFGVLICYEDTDPHLARKYNSWSGQPEPVDFLVNISNDGWFDGSEEHELHVAICRFRAVEARRSIVRAVNMGISCVIDPDGRVTDWVGEPWGGSKKMTGVLAAGVRLDTRGSPYAYLGDWVPAVCWAGVLLGLFAGRVRRKPAVA